VRTVLLAGRGKVLGISGVYAGRPQSSFTTERFGGQERGYRPPNGKSWGHPTEPNPEAPERKELRDWIGVGQRRNLKIQKLLTTERKRLR
jgi:hypothetical protein